MRSRARALGTCRTSGARCTAACTRPPCAPRLRRAAGAACRARRRRGRSCVPRARWRASGRRTWLGVG
eukprot:scaffold31112_cov56-Phaeocystis_antarctica.AAC.2